MTDIPLLERPLSSPETINASYLDAIVRDGVFPAGQFQIALPKLWSVQTVGSQRVPSADDPMVGLARFAAGAPEALGAERDAIVEVWAVFLPRVMNGSDWLRSWCTVQELQVHAFRELPTDNGVMGDAVAVSLKTGRLHRMITMKDGDLVYLVDGSIEPRGAPQDPALQEIALMAASRFKLLAPSGQIYAEPMVDTRIETPESVFGFLLPQSWSDATPPAAPIGGAAKRFVTKLGDTVTGTLVAISADANETPDALEYAFLQTLSAQNQTIGDAQKLLEARRGRLEYSAWIRRGTIDGLKTTILCLRAQVERRPLSMVLISAAADSQFETWAVNRRVFEIILETLDGERM